MNPQSYSLNSFRSLLCISKGLLTICIKNNSHSKLCPRTFFHCLVSSIAFITARISQSPRQPRRPLHLVIYALLQSPLIFDQSYMRVPSRVQLFTTLWNVAHQAPLSMGFPGKNTGEGCHFLLQGIFPTQGLNLNFLYLLHCR